MQVLTLVVTIYIYLSKVLYELLYYNDNHFPIWLKYSLVIIAKPDMFKSTRVIKLCCDKMNWNNYLFIRSFGAVAHNRIHCFWLSLIAGHRINLQGPHLARGPCNGHHWLNRSCCSPIVLLYQSKYMPFLGLVILKQKDC